MHAMATFKSEKTDHAGSGHYTPLCFAGLVNFLIAPLFGALHITTALGVHIAPGLIKVSIILREQCLNKRWQALDWSGACNTQGDLYQKLVWGGVFGLLFLIPLRKYVRQWWLRACIFGELPI